MPKPIYLWVLGLSVALYLYSRTQSGQGAAAAVTDYVGNLLTPRGIRNNNPGNIRRNAINWQGELVQADVEALGKRWDPLFVQFGDPAYGVRALGHVLTAYSNRNLSTVAAIIAEYSATDQGAYIQNVADALGVGPDDTIDVVGNLPALATAIIQQENGSNPYAPNDIQAWVYS